MISFTHYQNITVHFVHSLRHAQCRRRSRRWLCLRHQVTAVLQHLCYWVRIYTCK